MKFYKLSPADWERVRRRKQRELENVFGDGPATIEGVLNVTGRSERWAKTWLADGLARGVLERFKSEEPTGGRPSWVYRLTYTPKYQTWPKDKPRPRTFSPTDPPMENLLRMLHIKDGQTAVIEVTSQPKTVLYHKRVVRARGKAQGKYERDDRVYICAGDGCLLCRDGPPTPYQVCDIIVESIDGKPPKPLNSLSRSGRISALSAAPPIPVPDRLRYFADNVTGVPAGRGEWKRTGKGKDTRYTFSAKLMVAPPAERFVQISGRKRRGRGTPHCSRPNRDGHRSLTGKRPAHPRFRLPRPIYEGAGRGRSLPLSSTTRDLHESRATNTRGPVREETGNDTGSNTSEGKRREEGNAP